MQLCYFLHGCQMYKIFLPVRHWKSAELHEKGFKVQNIYSAPMEMNTLSFVEVWDLELQISK